MRIYIPDKSWLAKFLKEFSEKTGLPRWRILEMFLSNVKLHKLKNKLIRTYKAELEWYELLKKQEIAYKRLGEVIRFQRSKQEFEKNLPRLLDKTIPYKVRQEILNLLKEVGVSRNLTEQNLTMNRVFETLKER